MAAGVATSDADAFLFVDADCTGLTGAHLDAICEPVVEGEAAMSIGFFDYGPILNPLVRVLPPLSGERIVPREVWESVPPRKLNGYTIELRLDEAVAERRGRVVVRTMPGVQHRTKRDKHGGLEGYRRTYWMYRDIVRQMRPTGDVRWRNYPRYLRGLTIRR
jgi:hypothetical protein